MEENNKNSGTVNHDLNQGPVNTPNIPPPVIKIDQPTTVVGSFTPRPNKHKALLFLIMLAICSLIALAGVHFYYQRDGRALEQESQNLQEINELKQQIQQLEESLDLCGQEVFDDSDY